MCKDKLHYCYFLFKNFNCDGTCVDTMNYRDDLMGIWLTIMFDKLHLCILLNVISANRDILPNSRIIELKGFEMPFGVQITGF